MHVQCNKRNMNAPRLSYDFPTSYNFLFRIFIIICNSCVLHISIQLIALHQITIAFYILCEQHLNINGMKVQSGKRSEYLRKGIHNEERENRPFLIINLWVLICTTWSINIWKRIFCVMNSNENWRKVCQTITHGFYKRKSFLHSENDRGKTGQLEWL